MECSQKNEGLEYHQKSVDVRDRRSFVLASFEAHFSPSDIGDMLAVEEGKIRSCGARENCAEIPPCQAIGSGNRDWGRCAIEKVTFCCHSRSLFLGGKGLSSSVFLLIYFKELMNLLVDLSFELCRVKALVKLC